MALPANLKILAGKLEAVKGTAETLTAAEAQMVVAEVNFNPDVEMVPRGILSPSFSQFSQLVGKQAAFIQVKTHLQGASAAGTAPKFGEFFKAGGFAEAIVALTSVTYTPESPGTNTMTLAEYHDDDTGSGLKHPIAGAMMRSLRLVGEIGKPTMIEAEFWGKWQDTIDAAPLAPTLDTIKPPVLLGATFTVDGFAAQISRFTIDLGLQIELVQDISEATGYAHAKLVGRNPTVSFDPLKTLVATYDWLGKFKAGSEGLFSLAYGSSAGNIVTITAPKMQYTQMGEGNRNGLGTYDVTASLNRNAGDDELSIAFT